MDFPIWCLYAAAVLSISFTGEKLTAEQLSLVFDRLRDMYPSLVADRFLTCVPSEQAVPHYNVLLVGEQRLQSSHELLAARCDELLSEINCEYKSKRASGRLGPVTVIDIAIKEFAEHNASWETQFKFLPLTLHPLLSKHITRVP